MRVTDMSLDTLRMLFAGFIGVIQAVVFILAVSTVLRGSLNVWTVLGYAGGFGAGVMLGMFEEDLTPQPPSLTGEGPGERLNMEYTPALEGLRES